MPDKLPIGVGFTSGTKVVLQRPSLAGLLACAITTHSAMEKSLTFLYAELMGDYLDQPKINLPPGYVVSPSKLHPVGLQVFDTIDSNTLKLQLLNRLAKIGLPGISALMRNTCQTGYSSMNPIGEVFRNAYTDFLREEYQKAYDSMSQISGIPDSAFQSMNALCQHTVMVARALTDALSAMITAGVQSLPSLKTENGQIDLIEEEANRISVFPNPANNILNIVTLSESEHRLTIFDLHGKLILTSQFAGTFQVDVADWKSGMYFIEVQGEEGTKSFSVVVE